MHAGAALPRHLLPDCLHTAQDSCVRQELTAARGRGARLLLLALALILTLTLALALTLGLRLGLGLGLSLALALALALGEAAAGAGARLLQAAAPDLRGGDGAPADGATGVRHVGSARVCLHKPSDSGDGVL